MSKVKTYSGHAVPDGATCFVESCEAYKPHFGKEIDGIEYVFSIYNDHPEWNEISNIIPLSKRGAIELPEEEDNQEWADGLPPIGCECQATWLELPDGGGNDFCDVIIKGYFGGEVWLSKVNGVDGYSEVVKITDCEFRKPKTQEEKDREALILSFQDAVCDAIATHTNANWVPVEDITTKLMALFDIKPKGDL